MKIFITRNIPEAGLNFLRKEKINFDIYAKDTPIPRKELIKNLEFADGVISLLTEKFDPSLIDKMKNCKVIANFAVGYNNIDVEYAKKKNIIVTNTPDVLTDSTADLAMALVLACSRRIIEGEKMVRNKEFEGWKPRTLLGIELKNKNFGIIGAGRIGTATAIRAKSFGTKIIYHSNHKNVFLEKETGARKVSLNNLLKISDFISVHLPLNDKTYHFLNKENLKFLKKTCVIVNTARGEVMDEKALIDILKKKKIFAAGLDVFENEPKINPEFLKLKNVVLLPHIGSATEETRDQMAVLAAKNVAAVLKGKKPVTPVN